MKLTKEQIFSIATGATYISENENGSYTLHRFTEAEEELYREKKNQFYLQVFCPAGIKLAFRTDSRSIRIKGETKLGTSRSYMAVEVFADGKRVGIQTNYSDLEIPKLYTVMNCPFGEVDCSYDLGEGEKKVEVILPWSVAFDILEVSIDDGATLISVKRDKLLLAYGDSISQGYDALEPSHRYTAALSAMLGADEHNRAIGGEIFFPDLAGLADRELKPDLITVAYGTNDWKGRNDKELFKVHARGFFDGLAAAYPDTPIFVFAPIWRKESEAEERPLGTLEGMADRLRQLTSHIPTVTVIEGYDAVPHSEDYFADLHLHPNDCGYSHQAKSFFEKLSKYI